MTINPIGYVRWGFYLSIYSGDLITAIYGDLRRFIPAIYGDLFRRFMAIYFGDLSGNLSLGLDRPVDRQDIIPICTLWLWDADLDRLILI